jgi:hypothetical protein
MDRDAAQARLDRIGAFTRELLAIFETPQRTTMKETAGLSGQMLVIPHELARAIEPFAKPGGWGWGAAANGPGIRLAIGNRYQPWIAAIEPLTP